MSADDPSHWKAPESRLHDDWGPSRYVGRPAVWGWYTAYCIVMALMYLGLAALMALAMLGAFLDESNDPDKAFALVMMPILGAFGLVLGGVFAAGPMLPRRPWAWVYGIVLIALGLTSCCLMPATIPLLIFWIKPEVRWYYGKA